MTKFRWWMYPMIPLAPLIMLGMLVLAFVYAVIRFTMIYPFNELCNLFEIETPAWVKSWFPSEIPSSSASR